MRIAFTNWSNRMVGGAEHYLAEVAARMLSHGHELSLWHQTSVPEDRPVVPVTTCIPTWDVSRMGTTAALAALREWQPEIIYCQGSLDPETEAPTLEIAPSVFFAHNYHGTCISGSKCHSFPVLEPCNHLFGPACLVHYFPRRCGGLNPVTMLKAYRLNVQRLDLLSRYTQVVTHSESLMREYTRHGVNCERLRFFGNANDVGQGLAPKWDPATSWRLLMIGRMMATKGGQLLLDALPLLSKRLERPICLTLAGDGPSRGDWEKHANRIMMQSPGVEIKFPGWVTGGERDRLFSKADLLVVPSVWPEPFGIVGIEAGTWGVPAAGFRVGGIPDWLADGENGTLANADPPSSRSLADALARALADEATYRRLRMGAFNMSRQMNIETHYDDLMAVFERVRRAPAVAAPAYTETAAAVSERVF